MKMCDFWRHWGKSFEVGNRNVEGGRTEGAKLRNWAGLPKAQFIGFTSGFRRQGVEVLYAET